MEQIYAERMTADMESEFVVFLIGMRINKSLKIHKWLPVGLAMAKMIKELYANPNLGFLSHEAWFGRSPLLIQYWKSFEQLRDYATNRNTQHLPAWREFNEKIGSNGDVGIWHETYVVNQGNYECIYHNMPKFGLAKVGSHVPAIGKYKTAAGRMAQREAK
ncbi:MAG: transcriptional regulator [Gammaproteobacteria bacterium SG8_11]|nr:MAG: transcriptional regulator [Gammaproteobacteria bacterium SG8_11]